MCVQECRRHIHQVCSYVLVRDVCFMSWVASLELALLPSLSNNKISDHIKYVGPDPLMSLRDEDEAVKRDLLMSVLAFRSGRLPRRRHHIPCYVDCAHRQCATVSQ